MKKLMFMALMAASATTVFAQEDALKNILKSNSYDAAAQLVKSNEATFNAEQKAKAYNKLVELSLAKVDKEQQIMTANATAEQLKQDNIQPYDTLGYYVALYNALDNALIVDKYDQMPNEKGKVKPKFHKANQDRLYPLRPYIISAGQEAMKKNDAKEAYKNFKMYVETAENRTIVLPKTSKGKPKKLNYTATTMFTRIGMYFMYNDGYIVIANSTTQKTFYWTTVEGKENKKLFEKWFETWKKETTEEDLRELETFKNEKRKKQKYKEGDIFAFKIGRRNYGFGKIIIDVTKRRKSEEFI